MPAKEKSKKGGKEDFPFTISTGEENADLTLDFLPAEEILDVVSTVKKIKIFLEEKNFKILESYLTGGETGTALMDRYINLVSSMIYSPKNIMFDIVPEGGFNFREEEQPFILSLKNKIESDFVEEGIDEFLFECAKWGELFGCIGTKLQVTKKGITPKLLYPWEILFYYPELPIDDPSQIIVIVNKMGKREAQKRFGVELTEKADVPKGVFEGGQLFERIQENYMQIENPTGIEKSSISEVYTRYLLGFLRGFRDLIEIYEVWYKEQNHGKVCVAIVVGDQVVEHRVNPILQNDYPFAFYIGDPIVNSLYGRGSGERALKIQEKLDEWVKFLDFAAELLCQPPLLIRTLQGIYDIEKIKQELTTPGGAYAFESADMQVQPYTPQIPLDVIFNVINYYEKSLVESLGMNELLTGTSMKNVRSASHAQLLAMLGGSAIESKSLKFEQFLERLMTLWAYLLRAIDEEGKYSVLTPFRMEVYAHTSSPISALSYMEIIFTLMDAGVIPPDILIEILPIPMKWKIKNLLTKMKT
jgi:hypothetical protein